MGTERVKPRLLWYVFPQMPAEQGVGPNPVPMAALGACGPQGQVSSSSFSTGVEGAPFMHFTLTFVCFLFFKLNLPPLHARGQNKAWQLLAGHHGHPGSLVAFVEDEGQSCG